MQEFDIRNIVILVRKWKQLLDISSHQLSHYPSINCLLNEAQPKMDHEILCHELHMLAVDIALELLRGIQQKV